MFSVLGVIILILLAILFLVYLSLPITRLVLYSKYSKEPCPVEPNMNLYLIASGIIDIIWPVLLAILPFCSEKSFQTTITTYQHWIKHPGSSWKKNGTTEEKSEGNG